MGRGRYTTLLGSPSIVRGGGCWHPYRIAIWVCVLYLSSANLQPAPCGSVSWDITMLCSVFMKSSWSVRCVYFCWICVSLRTFHFWSKNKSVKVIMSSQFFTASTFFLYDDAYSQSLPKSIRPTSLRFPLPSFTPFSSLSETSLGLSYHPFHHLGLGCPICSLGHWVIGILLWFPPPM